MNYLINNRMIISKKIKNVSFLFFFLFSYLVIGQTNYYVSAENGNNSNNGTTQNTPFLTIAKAISLVTPGSTIFVMNGTYRNTNFNFNKQLGVNPPNLSNGAAVNINKSGTPGNPITLKNLDGHKPVIEFDGAGGININAGANYITIEGFEIIGPSQFINYTQAEASRQYKILVAEDNNDQTNFNHNYFNGSGIYGFGKRNNIIIRNNNVHDTPGSGIRLNDSDRVTFEYNTVYNTTWWSSSAPSAMVLAETVADDEVNDNGTAIKMIIRGNIVYNNWNRILFYTTQLPDNSNNSSQTYGTASFTQIWDGQGIYITRSDPGYKGTFLVENNLCVNNGKNGISFDHSQSASGIFRNNTLYFNGVHEIIQNLSAAEGNTAHRGNKNGGFTSNGVKNTTIVNNIVVMRDNQFAALLIESVSGTKKIEKNIFRNGTIGNIYKPNNLININPLFVNAPSTVNGAINMASTDFSLNANSPAINAGDTTNTPELDITQQKRIISTIPTNADQIKASNFEGNLDSWESFGNATINLSSDQFKSGSRSLFVTNRQYTNSSPKLDLDALLTVGQTYTFSAWVRLVSGVTGTSQITIKKSINGTVTYTDLTPEVTASSESWTQLTGDYTYDTAVNTAAGDYILVFIKGPVATAISQERHYFIDNFSLIKKGADPVDFDAFSNTIVDLGAYEFHEVLSLNNQDISNANSFIVYPNPASNYLYLDGISSIKKISIYNVLGKEQSILKTPELKENKATLNIEHLKSGIYFVKLHQANNSISIKKFIKQ